MRQQRQHPKRERSRGVVAIELALSLVFLAPLLLSTLDFGYYFYIGSNAEDAARAGVRQAVRIGGGAACGSAPALLADTTGETPAASPGGVGCINGSAYCYMNEPPLSMGGPGGYTTVTLSCAMVAGTPTWTINVTVDFPPAIGFFAPLMPRPPLPVTDKVRYRTTLVSN